MKGDTNYVKRKKSVGIGEMVLVLIKIIYLKFRTIYRTVFENILDLNSLACLLGIEKYCMRLGKVEYYGYSWISPYQYIF